MVDGMGLSGAEGVFRRVAEITMTVLRNNRSGRSSLFAIFLGLCFAAALYHRHYLCVGADTRPFRSMLQSVLESFLHDPLVEWSRQGVRLQSPTRHPYPPLSAAFTLSCEGRV
jgi:phosphatidylinositol kinase/protein kinase (PI-3  family)